MPDQKIIERFVDEGKGGWWAIRQEMPAPAVQNTRVRVHIAKDTEAPSLADDVIIDLSKLPKEAELNVRKFGEKGLAVSAKDPENNAVFEFVFDDAKDVKRLILTNGPNGPTTEIYFNVIKMMNLQNDPIPRPVIFEDKLPIEEVQKTLEDVLKGTGFKFYNEDPSIDQRKGDVIPPMNPARTAYNAPPPMPESKGLGLA